MSRPSHHVGPAGGAGADRRFATTLGEAEGGEHRDQQGEREEWVDGSAVPGAEAKRGAQPETPVDPRQGNHEELTGAQLRPELPQGESDDPVRVLEAVQLVGEPRSHDVRHEQDGQHEPEAELPGVGRRQPQVPALVECPEGEGNVDQDSAVEEDGAGQASPEREEPPPARLHRVQRDQPESVVQQVGRHEGEQDEAGRQPELTHPGRSAPGPEGHRSHYTGPRARERRAPAHLAWPASARGRLCSPGRHPFGEAVRSGGRPRATSAS